MQDENLEDFQFYRLTLTRKSLNEILSVLANNDHVGVNIDTKGNVSFDISSENGMDITSINFLDELIAKAMDIQKQQFLYKKDSSEFNDLEYKKEKIYDAIELLSSIIDKYDKGDDNHGSKKELETDSK